MTASNPTIWPTVAVVPFKDTDDVIWRDGKPWCAHHRWRCLVRAETVLDPCPEYAAGRHVCGPCMHKALHS